MSASLRFAPMPLAVLHEPFDHDDFIFELKYDGFRALRRALAMLSVYSVRDMYREAWEGCKMNGDSLRALRPSRSWSPCGSS